MREDVPSCFKKAYHTPCTGMSNPVQGVFLSKGERGFPNGEMLVCKNFPHMV